MKTKTTFSSITILFFSVCIAITGCGGDQENKSSENTRPSNYDASALLAKAELEGAKDVIAARKDSRNNDEIVLVGRIGGSIVPWVKGRAAFSIVDRSLKACSDDKEDGEPCSCKTPWDYCCETDKLKSAMVLVKFVEKDGKVIKHDAREIFPVKELQTVIIQGKAQRDDSGNLTVLATQMYVKK